MRHLIVIVLLLFATRVHADCAQVPDKIVKAKIEKIHAPIYFADGNETPGCLLEADGKVLGLSNHDVLCQTPLGTTLTLRLSYGCCDTGPDSGDKSCVVRAKNALGFKGAHGNGVIVESADTGTQ